MIEEVNKYMYSNRTWMDHVKTTYAASDTAPKIRVPFNLNLGFLISLEVQNII